MLLMVVKHQLRSPNKEEIGRRRLSKKMVTPNQLQLEMELRQLMEKAPKKRNLDKERKESQETLKRLRPMVEISQHQNIESRVKKAKKRARLKVHQQKEAARRREGIPNPKMPKRKKELMDLLSQNIELRAKTTMRRKDHQRRKELRMEKISQNKRKIWFIKTLWTSKKKRSSRTNGKNTTMANGKEDQAKLMLRWRRSFRNHQQSRLLLQMRQTTGRESKILMMPFLLSTRDSTIRRLNLKISWHKSRPPELVIVVLLSLKMPMETRLSQANRCQLSLPE